MTSTGSKFYNGDTDDPQGNYENIEFDVDNRTRHASLNSDSGDGACSQPGNGIKGDEKPPRVPSKLKISLGSVAIKSRPGPNQRNSYDPVTINFGKPVIKEDNRSSAKNDDFFGNVSFQSPISDMTEGEKEALLAVAPIPAPRFSKRRKSSPIPDSLDLNNQKSFSDDEDIYENISDGGSPESPKPCEGFISSSGPDLPDRNTPLAYSEIRRETTRRSPIHPYENVYCEVNPQSNSKFNSSTAQNIMDREEDEPTRKFKIESSKRGAKKSETIDIRQTVSRWYEEAEEEVSRDLSLDLSALEEVGSAQKARIKANPHQYEHVALTDAGSKFTLVNGQAVKIPKGTLLRDFDPCFAYESFAAKMVTIDADCSSSDSDESDDGSIVSSGEKTLDYVPISSNGQLNSPKDITPEREPIKNSKRQSSYSSIDMPPPAITPPPLPTTNLPPTPPPRATCSPKVHLPSYERVWIVPGPDPQIIVDDVSVTPQSPTTASPLSLASPKYKKSKLPDSSFPVPPLNRTESDVSILSGSSGRTVATEKSSARLNLSISPHTDTSDSKQSGFSFRSRSCSKTSNPTIDVEESEGWTCFENPNSDLDTSDNESKCSDLDGTGYGILKQPSFLRKSFSSLNITKIATSIKKKMSDQVVMRSVIDSRPASGFYHRKSTISDGGCKHHSGVLMLYSRIKRSFQSKWCILGDGNFRYFNDKDSLAIPKSLINLSNILSIRKHDSPTVSGSSDDQPPVYSFDLVYSISPGKHILKSFGASSEAERETWVIKIAQSLSFRLETIELENFGYILMANLKTGFAGKWERSWIMGSKDYRMLRYTTSDLGSVEELDLKRVKNLTFVKNSKNLFAPDPTMPVLVLDATDRSLYFQVENEKECQILQDFIESVAFCSTNALKDQQLTQDGIPVIVDKCICFVYSHGCLTEGIYRLSGVNTKINKLLIELSQNAWNVHISRESYSEHDVANALKRFMRTLDEPLLTYKLRSDWLTTSGITDYDKKFDGYRQLVKKLPPINYLTLRRLVGHLHAIADRSSRNLMPNYNLAALWGPTLLTVDSSVVTAFTSAESDVCKDLIDLYEGLFKVNKEELERERKITEVLEKLNFQDQTACSIKRSGDLRMWVYLDTRSAGRSVCVVVHPSMTALEMTNIVKKESNAGGNDNWVLHEVVLGGELERPIHHSEMILDLTLKWGTWSDSDRRDNHLLMKSNIFYEEALSLAVPPMTFFGEASFLDNKPKASFKTHQFTMHNARLSVCRDGKPRHTIGGNNSISEIGAWNIEDISWYFGCESKKKPPFNMNVSFIDRDKPVERTKEQPNFGRIISFESRETFIKFAAAMLVAEHSNNIVPSPPLLNID